MFLVSKRGSLVLCEQGSSVYTRLILKTTSRAKKYIRWEYKTISFIK